MLLSFVLPILRYVIISVLAHMKYKISFSNVRVCRCCSVFFRTKCSLLCRLVFVWSL
ncbi:hypothetical protein M758_10G167100 [Ceratodon purpureus]|uniref:Uncharacterized protein n=1 Tax=Ceratodon purpureus TaxID=3225 RepID=A0A8T0GQ35_CERPU|nr:hypothetical protein KC19_10G172000 [Ceratodon purpureus]KAG0604371.1 hypothetical protein M758_10G167100 [Ceratodon purpureus]